MRSLKFIFLVSLPCHASLEKIVLHKIQSAKTAHQVARIHADWLQFKLLKRACELELNRHQVPLSCYKALAVEQKWHSLPSLRKAYLVQVLDQRCLKAIKNLNLPVRGLSLDFLSSSCRKNVEEGWEIESYRNQNNWSEC